MAVGRPFSRMVVFQVFEGVWVVAAMRCFRYEGYRKYTS
ncbi:hypothetical protein BMS3Bbin12_00964 [bacterium BMS3Bbin12]|nr:hypothetical protein BMS3Abin12_01488 [bacterium BMS3Abin12]GBE47797.1 hypothetical protein BMS3Bbin12_00964 [bacterium BMS3Bbin12]GBE51044.1 hypothetical protein BMS3Bbin13_01997 [bacterium BMS3Bbin13]